MNYKHVLKFSNIAVKSPLFAYGEANGDKLSLVALENFSLGFEFKYFGKLINTTQVDLDGIIRLQHAKNNSEDFLDIAVFQAADLKRSFYYRQVTGLSELAELALMINLKNFVAENGFVVTWHQNSYDEELFVSFQWILIRDQLGNTFMVFNYERLDVPPKGMSSYLF